MAKRRKTTNPIVKVTCTKSPGHGRADHHGCKAAWDAIRQPHARAVRDELHSSTHGSNVNTLRNDTCSERALLQQRSSYHNNHGNEGDHRRRKGIGYEGHRHECNAETANTRH
jgi:hypothetical protein